MCFSNISNLFRCVSFAVQFKYSLGHYGMYVLEKSQRAYFAATHAGLHCHSLTQAHILKLGIIVGTLSG